MGQSRPSSPENIRDRLGTEDLPDAQGAAIKALNVTNQDTVIETADGHRLPGVPLSEAKKLNALRSAHNSPSSSSSSSSSSLAPSTPGFQEDPRDNAGSTTVEMAPCFTDPLFPPVPVYGPATPLRRAQCAVFRVSSGILSLCFLLVVVLGAIFESIPEFVLRWWALCSYRDLDADRPFAALEKSRAAAREKLEEEDALVCDIRYYARRVGLDVERYEVETEDGFLLQLWHVFDPMDLPYYPEATDADREKLEDGEQLPRTALPRETEKRRNGREGRSRYPVLLIHGLLQSAGAYCVNDDDSLAFYLVKCGYDVFLGDNRCGFQPKHTVLSYSDPRMWAWNIRQMGILDLPAFIEPILSLTSYRKLALITHSQGTTQTFVALAKQQRPDLGDKISVFCALAPAVYAGPLINKFYFKFMKLIPPWAFRIIFGIHSFIPFMMTMHSVVPARLYGQLGYRVFWFLFGWSDTRWDRNLRDRFFQFAPVYVSAEAMRWWLGRECFARHKCVLSTHSAGETPESGGGSWFDERFPKLAMWVAGSDALVDGKRLLARFGEGKEPSVELVHAKVIEEYEHLDVVWAIDARKQVFEEVAMVIENCGEEES
ncbi:Alpha/Beta hydrolase protein [Sphaerosporella brunnea]|uniref:Alpha/Beta hydrolase protein n=1 Tax=Sphaerosporella brunnea TaxID=1250544 RepID=A0A5J5FBF0_9PEZI|nr:Alpha/Beta hydrolase protein [Sphaerosporella brunnea]